MSKARDLANASTALSAVSPTELGYVDGVTSAIQTQLDGKIAKTLTTTTGDTIYASGANTPARLGVGSTGQVLTVAGGVPTWASPAGGGKILQVVESRNTTQRSTTTQWTSWASSGWTVSITPTSSTSKILIIASIPFATVKNANDAGGGVRLTRSGTLVFPSTAVYSQYVSASGTGTLSTTVGLTCLDAPATTSAVTYSVEFQQSSGSTTAYISFQTQEASIVLMEVGA